MSILGNKNNLLEEEETSKKTYTVPVMVTKEEEGITLKKALLISTLLHPTAVGVLWLASVIALLLGIQLFVLNPPEPKQNDIEFVLVDGLEEQTPKNKNTKYRSNKNTRTGGINNPKKKVSMPSPSPTKKAQPKKSSAGGAKAQQPVKKQQKAAVQPQQSKVQPKKGAEAKPAPPSTRPSVKPAEVPKVTQQPKSSFQIPVPSGGTSTAKTYSTGPVGGKGTSTKGGTKTGTGTGSHSPSLAPTSGTGRGAGTGTGRGSSGYGNPGNPGGGGGAPGIDSYREPDFGPYMNELQRRIRANWDPPKGNESKRVVLLFKIAKDGRLLSCRVLKSSGLPNADKAAMNAVQLTAPFKPLPVGYRESSVDIQFTFDYNVFGGSAR